MAGRSSKNNNRGSDLFGYFVSGKYKEFHTHQYAGYVTPRGITASGGNTNEYTDPVSGYIYRSHVFTATGTFNVTATGAFGNTVDYLTIGGGGGGGSAEASAHDAGTGGGGGGAFVTGSFTATASPYAITVGGGGGTAAAGTKTNGSNGGESWIGPPSSKIGPAIGGGGGARSNS